MITYIKKGITSEKIGCRFLYIIILYLAIFIVCTIVGDLLLPEGFLRNAPTNTGGEIDFSSNLFISSLQIFLYNCISLVVIIVASLFAKRKTEEESYFPASIACLSVLAVITGLTLGTNSFGIVVENAPVLQKLMDLFYVTKYSALWEITGQTLIAACLAKKSLVLTTGKTTVVKKIDQIGFTKREIVLIGFGLSLMIFGAFIESRTILSL